MIPFSEPLEVADVRARIAEIKLELQANQTAPLSDEEALVKAKAMIDAHARTAQTGLILAHLIHRDASARIGWPSDHQGVPIEPSAFDLLCALDPKRMLEMLRKQISASDHIRGPHEDERNERIRALKGDLRAAEIDEEALICAAESRGHLIHRRADADPAVILGATE